MTYDFRGNRKLSVFPQPVQQGKKRRPQSHTRTTRNESVRIRNLALRRQINGQSDCMTAVHALSAVDCVHGHMREMAENLSLENSLSRNFFPEPCSTWSRTNCASAAASQPVQWQLRNTAVSEFVFSNSRFSLGTFNTLPHLTGPELIALI
jgi:hypothetical protein